MYMLDDLEKRIIHYLQGDLPLTFRPFTVLARKVGISEKELIEKIRLFKSEGVLRRFGANLDHQRAGYKGNAMVAWYVPEGKIEDVGKAMAAFREVSHCYQRKTQGSWKHNLFTMIHGKTEKDCEGTARRIADNTGIEDYVLLFTLEEYKKTSPKYF